MRYSPNTRHYSTNNSTKQQAGHYAPPFLLPERELIFVLHFMMQTRSKCCIIYEIQKFLQHTEIQQTQQPCGFPGNPHKHWISGKASQTGSSPTAPILKAPYLRGFFIFVLHFMMHNLGLFARHIEMHTLKVGVCQIRHFLLLLIHRMAIHGFQRCVR